nr:hypothetical protein [Tanacetum cinerariifolium]
EVQLLGAHLRRDALGVESRKRTDNRSQDAHGMGRRREAVENLAHIFVHQRVLGNLIAKCVKLRLRRQRTVNQQVSDFQEAGLLGELLDGIAPVAQNAFLAVEKRNSAFGGAGVFVAWVVGNVAGLVAQLADVEGLFMLGAFDNGQANRLAI